MASLTPDKAQNILISENIRLKDLSLSAGISVASIRRILEGRGVSTGMLEKLLTGINGLSKNLYTALDLVDTYSLNQAQQQSMSLIARLDHLRILNYPVHERFISILGSFGFNIESLRWGGEILPAVILTQLDEDLRKEMQSANNGEAITEEDRNPANDNGIVELIRSAPEQNQISNFVFTSGGRLKLLSPPSGNDDIDTIDVLRRELRSEHGPIARLNRWFDRNPNIPQAPYLRSLVNAYAEELSKEIGDLNIAVLYSRGTQLQAASKRTERHVESGDWPALDAPEAEALESLCELHGPLIMATSKGRQLVADARNFTGDSNQIESDMTIMHEFGQALSSATDLLEPESLEAVGALTAQIDEDPYPTRSYIVSLAVTGSALTVMVGGSLFLLNQGHTVSGALVGGVGMLMWEAGKKTAVVKQTTDTVAQGYDKLVRAGHARATIAHRELLIALFKFVRDHEELILRVAAITPAFDWVKRSISKLNSAGKEFDSTNP